MLPFHFSQSFARLGPGSYFGGDDKIVGKLQYYWLIHGVEHALNALKNSLEWLLDLYEHKEVKLRINALRCTLFQTPL